MTKTYNFLGAALAVGMMLAISACTDTTSAKLMNYGNPARVTCFSGGKSIFDDFSTGRVENSTHSDGYEFVSTSTTRLTHVSGDCVVDYGAHKPDNFHPIHPSIV